MRLLLIEDSQRLQQSIARGLTLAGFAVDVAGDGTNGLWRACHGSYDVIILDLLLPGLDGLTVLKQLREKGVASQVLILSAKDTVEDRVLGLQTGSDDYLIKPFAFDELLARVHALVRRAHGTRHPVLRIGDLEIDTAARLARRNKVPIELAPREFALLEYLVLRRGHVVSRTDIETHIYDDSIELMSNVVDSAVCALRRRIDVPDRPSIIRTRRGAGYIVDGEE